MKITIKEVGQHKSIALAGYHDVPSARGCEECETRATRSMVIGKRDESNKKKKIIRLKIGSQRGKNSACAKYV